MWYTVDMEVEIDVQDAFDCLSQEEKNDFICGNIEYASDECLLTEIHDRGLKIVKVETMQELVNGARDMFLVGGVKAKDFLADCLGLQHSASLDEIINNLKSVLQ